MELQQEVWVSFPDIPRFLTALAEWFACMVCLFQLNRKKSTAKVYIGSILYLILLCTFLIATKDTMGLIWVICMLLAIGSMGVFFYIMCEISWKHTIFYAMWAFLVAEFSASLEWQIYCYCHPFLSGNYFLVLLSVTVVIYGIVFVCMWKLTKRFQIEGELLDITIQELIVMATITLLVFSLSNLSFVFESTPFSGNSKKEIFNIRTIVDFGGIAILYAYYMQCKGMRVQNELNNIKNMLYTQYCQYEQSQKTLDLINYKYHDLKHYIHILRAEKNLEKRNEYLNKMEEEIQLYEAQNKTGNQVLDTLLTTKSMECMQNNISLTCVIDGALFSFMDAIDICSIFGNALDNAMEYVKNIKQEEKRLIHVSAFSQKNFLIIRFENYFEGSIKLEGKLPKTTKKETDFHGYGLKSLQYTVHKYKGEVDISIEKQWFHLKILIPL